MSSDKEKKFTDHAKIEEGEDCETPENLAFERKVQRLGFTMKGYFSALKEENPNLTKKAEEPINLPELRTYHVDRFKVAVFAMVEKSIREKEFTLENIQAMNVTFEEFEEELRTLAMLTDKEIKKNQLYEYCLDVSMKLDDFVKKSNK